MKQLVLLLLLVLGATAYAQSSKYTMRVDGLACPFCAYGIEKKLKAIDGVQHIDVDLNKGLVTVIGDNINFNDDKMKKLFQDAGFTFRSMTKTSVEGNK